MSGNLDITTDAMVYEVTLGRDGRANGVNFVDRISGKQRHAAARVVMLAASACESVRILLNSKTAQFRRDWRIPAARLGAT
jgi:choline dehydrogenase-like flavoprotein